MRKDCFVIFGDVSAAFVHHIQIIGSSHDIQICRIKFANHFINSAVRYHNMICHSDFVIFSPAAQRKCFCDGLPLHGNRNRKRCTYFGFYTKKLQDL